MSRRTISDSHQPRDRSEVPLAISEYPAGPDHDGARQDDRYGTRGRYHRERHNAHSVGHQSAAVHGRPSRKLPPVCIQRAVTVRNPPMRLIRRASILSLLAVSSIVAACAPMSPPVVSGTVPGVDLGRYAGTWYEVASVKQFFSVGLVNTQANYSANPDGSIRVENSGNYFFNGGPEVGGSSDPRCRSTRPTPASTCRSPARTDLRVRGTTGSSISSRVPVGGGQRSERELVLPAHPGQDHRLRPEGRHPRPGRGQGCEHRQRHRHPEF